MPVTAKGSTPPSPGKQVEKESFAQAAARIREEKYEVDVTSDKLLQALDYLQTLGSDAEGRSVQVIPARKTGEGYEIYVAYMNDENFAAFSQTVEAAGLPVAAVEDSAVEKPREVSVVSVTSGDPNDEDYVPFWAQKKTVDELQAQFREEAVETAGLSGSGGRKSAQVRLDVNEYPAIRFVVKQEVVKHNVPGQDKPVVLIDSRLMSYAEMLDRREVNWKNDNVEHPKSFERAGELWIPLLNWAKRTLAGRKDLPETLSVLTEIGSQRKIAEPVVGQAPRVKKAALA